MAITAADVKNLREQTGAGMLDCKKALDECGGDFEKAVDNLKKQGLAKALKKGDRIAAEGLIFSKITPEHAVLLELNCETDFVAKNDDFKKIGDELVALIASKKPANNDALLALTLNGQTVSEQINALVARIGEKISLRRFAVVEPQAGGRIGGYLHMGGRIVVALEAKGGNLSDELIKDLGMQVAAMTPRYVDKSQVPADVLAKEKEIQLEQIKGTKDASKPADILEKIMAGKLDKFASEMSLLQQVFVKDPSGKKTVAQHLAEVAGKESTIVRFERYAVGEGIEKKKEDFAEEVAKMVS